MDLVTVVMHELEHILGVQDGGTGLMSEHLMASTRFTPSSSSPLAKVFDHVTGIFLDPHEAANLTLLQAAANQGSLANAQGAGPPSQGSRTNPSTDGLGTGLASLIGNNVSEASNGGNGSNSVVSDLGSGAIPSKSPVGDGSDTGVPSLINWNGKFRGLNYSNLRPLR
jgi:hypothetical protein